LKEGCPSATLFFVKSGPKWALPFFIGQKLKDQEVWISRLYLDKKTIFLSEKQISINDVATNAYFFKGHLLQLDFYFQRNRN
jgi:hypothetical protein